MSIKKPIILSVTEEKLKEFETFGATLEMTRNKAIIYLASMKLNEMNESKKV